MARDDISIEHGDRDVAVVALTGEHEAYGAPQLEERLVALLAEGLGVVVDLTSATFLDSATLFVLLRAREHAAQRELGFVLQLAADADRHVRRTLELTRLVGVFAIAETRAAALAAAGVPVGAGPEPGA